MKLLFRTFFWKEVSLKNSKVIFEGCLFIIENSREEVFRWDTSWFPNEKILKNLIFLKVAVSKYSFDLYTKLDTSWSHSTDPWNILSIYRTKEEDTVSVLILLWDISTRDKRAQISIKGFLQRVPLCTTRVYVHVQKTSAGIFGNPLDTKYKTFQNFMF